MKCPKCGRSMVRVLDVLSKRPTEWVCMNPRCMHSIKIQSENERRQEDADKD